MPTFDNNISTYDPIPPPQNDNDLVSWLDELILPQ
jgi:hypothetical protein